ncbi:MAG TPA: hypothetical protein VII35_13770 [Steroidobacteraceae bacterium]
MVTHCVLLLALAAAHPAAASASKAHARTESDKYAAWTAQAAQVLGARADANSLATAAALTVIGSGLRADPSRSELAALDLAARASELAPQNAAIGWLRLQLCAQVRACDIRDIATVMRWVDPDNAAAWLPTLAAAQRDRDTTEVDRVLADMAREPHFDFYWNRIVVLMFDALDAAHGELSGGYAAADSARYTVVNGIASGKIIPPFGPLVEACRESAAYPERRDLCLRLSKTMQRGDTAIAQLIGFGIEKRLLAPDSKEVRAIAERRRVLEWRVAAAARFDNPLLPWTKNARARARLAQMRALPREEDVCIAILREHRMAVDPPEVHP